MELYGGTGIHINAENKEEVKINNNVIYQNENEAEFIGDTNDIVLASNLDFYTTDWIKDTDIDIDELFGPIKLVDKMDIIEEAGGGYDVPFLEDWLVQKYGSWIRECNFVVTGAQVREYSIDIEYITMYAREVLTLNDNVIEEADKNLDEILR